MTVRKTPGVSKLALGIFLLAAVAATAASAAPLPGLPAEGPAITAPLEVRQAFYQQYRVQRVGGFQPFQFDGQRWSYSALRDVVDAFPRSRQHRRTSVGLGVVAASINLPCCLVAVIGTQIGSLGLIPALIILGADLLVITPFLIGAAVEKRKSLEVYDAEMRRALGLDPADGTAPYATIPAAPLLRW